METTMKTPTYSEQAEIMLKDCATRKRKPLRSQSITTYKSQIETNVLPYIGDLALDAVGNRQVKGMTEKLTEKGLSPASISLILVLVKKIRASAVNEDDEELYPYKWSTRAIDAPELDKKAQKRPIADAGSLTTAISKASTPENALIALLAGAGMRIGEALALQLVDNKTNTFWDRVNSKIIVRQQRTDDKLGPVKTGAGVREVDLCKELNDYLEIALTPSEFLFPKSATTYGNYFKSVGLTGGFHSLRRFRVTHIRLASVPDPIVHFWIGHSDKSVTDTYTQVGEKIEARKLHAEKAGLGFQLEAK
jgi:integrase